MIGELSNSVVCAEILAEVCTQTCFSLYVLILIVPDFTSWLEFDNFLLAKTI